MVCCPTPFILAGAHINGVGHQTSEIERFDAIDFHRSDSKSLWNLSLIPGLVTEIPIYRIRI